METPKKSSPEQQFRQKLQSLRTEVQAMKEWGISDTERDQVKIKILQLKNEIQSHVGDGPHALYGELLETINDVKKHRVPKEGNEKEQQLPAKIAEALKTLEQTRDTSCTGIVQELREIFRKASQKEKTLLTECSPNIHILDQKESERVKTHYTITGRIGYSVLIDKNHAIQKAYLINPKWTPLLSFRVSTGKPGRTTPNYDGTLRKVWDRTFLFQKFGQSYKNQALDGMLDWESSHAQMTTAILALKTGSSFYLHGTNKEQNLGMPDSGWCVRFDNFSIAFLSRLYEKSPDNFHVTIIDKDSESEK